ncbi:MAG: glycosyltransferase family 4 protein [Pyrinomonadaceae bacterium]|nr:glycosyltransferase family 4 protein [Pyrinomonadaceae bacterium]
MGKYQFQTEVVKTISSVRAVSATRASIQADRRPVIVMVGMHLSKTRGGITTLTAAILGSELQNDYRFDYIASQAEDHSKPRKMLLAMSAFARFAVRILLDRPSLAYVHIGSNVSLYRESAFILLAKVFRTCVLAHFHAGDLDQYYLKQNALGRAFIRWALGRSDRIVAVSNASARALRELDDSLKISLVTNAIDTSIFGMRSPHRHEAKIVQLLFVGAAGKLKGERDLVKALGLLKVRRDLELRVSFIGHGTEDLITLCEEEGIAGIVEHLGPVPMSKRVKCFENADIFVLPTYAEAMPLGVIEAMAAGLAVITTPVGGIPELVSDGEDGLLFPCGDISALAERIAALASDPEARKRIGARAQVKARQHWDIDNYIPRLGREINATVELCKN